MQSELSNFKTKLPDGEFAKTFASLAASLTERQS